MQNVMNSLLWISLYLFYLDLEQKLLAEKHSIIWDRTKFDTEEKSSKLLFEIMILVSSALNVGSDEEFILGRRSVIYIMNNCPWIDPTSGKVWKEMELQVLLHHALPTASFVALNYTSDWKNYSNILIIESWNNVISIAIRVRAGYPGFKLQREFGFVSSPIHPACSGPLSLLPSKGTMVPP